MKHPNVMDPAMMELFTLGANGASASGPVGKKLMANGMDHNVLRPWIGNDGRAYITKIANGKAKAIPIFANATLRKDEWKEMDSQIVEAAKTRLVGVADLYAKGLVLRLSNGLGKTVLEYEDLSEMTAAHLDMDAVVHGQKDRPKYDLKYLPLPITHKEFSFNARVLAASRTSGDPVDTTAGMLAARVVAEHVESTLFTGASTFAYGGGTLYGYTDHPNRNTVTLSVNWDDSAKTGSLILDDVRAMKQASIDAKHYGPWALYVPTSYETTLDDDFKAESDKTIRQRILEIGGIETVKVVDSLPADTVVLVQLTADTVRIVEGLPLTTVEWDTHGGMATEYKVMTIMVPQIRADQYGNCGVTVLSA